MLDMLLMSLTVYQLWCLQCIILCHPWRLWWFPLCGRWAVFACRARAFACAQMIVPLLVLPPILAPVTAFPLLQLQGACNRTLVVLVLERERCCN